MRVVNLGAGKAGLTAAQLLNSVARGLFDLTVVEVGDRIGGCILTAAFADDCFEMGAMWIHVIGGPSGGAARWVHGARGHRVLEKAYDVLMVELLRQEMGTLKKFQPLLRIPIEVIGANH